MTKQELGNLIIASQEQMYRIAKTVLYDDNDCADAISEAIVRAFSRIDTLREDAYAKTWLTRILINECYSVHRMKKAFAVSESLAEQETQPLDYSDLYEAIYTLPKDVRMTVTLHYIEGYKVREIAQMMRVTEDVVKKRLAKGRSKLRTELDGQFVSDGKEVAIG